MKDFKKLFNFVWIKRIVRREFIFKVISLTIAGSLFVNSTTYGVEYYANFNSLRPSLIDRDRLNDAKSFLGWRNRTREELIKVIDEFKITIEGIDRFTDGNLRDLVETMENLPCEHVRCLQKIRLMNRSYAHAGSVRAYGKSGEMKVKLDTFVDLTVLHELAHLIDKSSIYKLDKFKQISR